MNWDKVKGVLFDLDGTLIDSLGVWQEVDIAYLKKRGIDSFPEGMFLHLSHMGFEGSCKYIIDYFGLDTTVGEMGDEILSMVRYEYANNLKLRPGAKEFISQLRGKGIRTAIVTANLKSLCESVLDANKVLDQMDFVVSVNEVTKDKSGPEVYLHGAKRLGLTPSEIVVFEDILTGIRSAKKAGFITIGVYDKNSEKDMAEIKAESHLYVEDFRELLEK